VPQLALAEEWSEAVLARRAAEGDARAEAGLCRALAPRIWAWGLRHLRDDHEARDLTQEVLVIMLEALRGKRVERPEQITSFVLGTCRLVARDRQRTQHRRQALLEQWAAELVSEALPPSGAPDFDRMFQCLRALSYQARQVLVMTFYEDAAAELIAADLQTSVGNVRVIRHRSLAQLRACLEQPGSDR